MKILMVSVFSQHFFNWTLQLNEAGHEIYWLDVYDSNTYVKKIDFVEQTIGWKNRIKYPGRYRIKQNYPRLNQFINTFNHRKMVRVFEQKMKDIQPDVVHSFVMYAACVPLLEVMKQYPETLWIYSAWGNDLFYYQNESKESADMKKVFPHIDYMFADCSRDLEIAKDHGFEGEYLGTFPTGGGYDFNLYNENIKEREEKKTIIVKGYEHKFGRGINVLKALSGIKESLEDFEIAVFAANDKVFDFVKNTSLKEWRNLKIYGSIGRDAVMELMGRSCIYIGNSISDGMPNTLLEAIIMEVYPIQTNPGGATSEIIDNGVNGLLINDAEDIDEIKNLILHAISNSEVVRAGVEYNNKYIKPSLERNLIKEKVVEKYKVVQNRINSGT